MYLSHSTWVNLVKYKQFERDKWFYQFQLNAVM